jgi:hypothetical protein
MSVQVPAALCLAVPQPAMLVIFALAAVLKALLGHQKPPASQTGLGLWRTHVSLSVSVICNAHGIQAP